MASDPGPYFTVSLDDLHASGINSGGDVDNYFNSSHVRNVVLQVLSGSGPQPLYVSQFTRPPGPAGWTWQPPVKKALPKGSPLDVKIAQAIVGGFSVQVETQGAQTAKAVVTTVGQVIGSKAIVDVGNSISTTGSAPIPKGLDQLHGDNPIAAPGASTAHLGFWRTILAEITHETPRKVKAK